MSNKRDWSLLWDIVKEGWMLITGFILIVVLAVLLATHKDDTGRGLLDSIAYEVGELVGEASKGFEDAKKK